jgi:ribulose-phosphate 3-epimerase
MHTLIAPSVLSADFGRLAEQIRLVEEGGADWLHLDIMDGHFVPNISFGPMIVKTIRGISKLPLDTHLMISSPDQYLEEFQRAGADRLTVHVESTLHLHRTIQRINELGMKAGVTLNPSTPIASIREILPYVDLVLIMSVNPGFGGQKFIATTLAKIKDAAAMIRDVRPEIFLQVDGGVDAANASSITGAGANVLVAGHAIFGKPSIPDAVRALRAAIPS